MAFLCPSRLGRKQKKGHQTMLNKISETSNIDSITLKDLVKLSWTAPEARRIILQSFTAYAAHELTVKQGQKVREIYREGDWAYIVTNEKKQGFVPYNVLAKLGVPATPTPNAKVIDTGTYTKKTFDIRKISVESEEAESVSDNADDSFVSSEWSNDSLTETGSLGVHRELDNLSLGVHGELDNLCPAIEVEPLRRVDDHENSVDNEIPPSPLAQYKVLNDYEGRDSDEVSVRANDIVHLLNTSDPNWSWVRTVDGAEGYMPSYYIKEISPSASLNSSKPSVNKGIGDTRNSNTHGGPGNNIDLEYEYDLSTTYCDDQSSFASEDFSLSDRATASDIQPQTKKERPQKPPRKNKPKSKIVPPNLNDSMDSLDSMLTDCTMNEVNDSVFDCSFSSVMNVDMDTSVDDIDSVFGTQRDRLLSAGLPYRELIGLHLRHNANKHRRSSKQLDLLRLQSKHRQRANSELTDISESVPKRSSRKGLENRQSSKLSAYSYTSDSDHSNRSRSSKRPVSVPAFTSFQESRNGYFDEYFYEDNDTKFTRRDDQEVINVSEILKMRMGKSTSQRDSTSDQRQHHEQRQHTEQRQHHDQRQHHEQRHQNDKRQNHEDIQTSHANNHRIQSEKSCSKSVLLNLPSTNIDNKHSKNNMTSIDTPEHEANTTREQSGHDGRSHSSQRDNGKNKAPNSGKHTVKSGNKDKAEREADKQREQSVNNGRNQGNEDTSQRGNRDSKSQQSGPSVTIDNKDKTKIEANKMREQCVNNERTHSSRRDNEESSRRCNEDSKPRHNIPKLNLQDLNSDKSDSKENPKREAPNTREQPVNGRKHSSKRGNEKPSNMGNNGQQSAKSKNKDKTEMEASIKKEQSVSTRNHSSRRSNKDSKPHHSGTKSATKNYNEVGNKSETLSAARKYHSSTDLRLVDESNTDYISNKLMKHAQNNIPTGKRSHKKQSVMKQYNSTSDLRTGGESMENIPTGRVKSVQNKKNGMKNEINHSSKGSTDTNKPHHSGTNSAKNDNKMGKKRETLTATRKYHSSTDLRMIGQSNTDNTVSNKLMTNAQTKSPTGKSSNKKQTVTKQYNSALDLRTSGESNEGRVKAVPYKKNGVNIKGTHFKNSNDEPRQAQKRKRQYKSTTDLRSPDTACKTEIKNHQQKHTSAKGVVSDNSRDIGQTNTRRYNSSTDLRNINDSTGWSFGYPRKNRHSSGGSSQDQNSERTNKPETNVINAWDNPGKISNVHLDVNTKHQNEIDNDEDDMELLLSQTEDLLNVSDDLLVIAGTDSDAMNKALIKNRAATEKCNQFLTNSTIGINGMVRGSRDVGTNSANPESRQKRKVTVKSIEVQTDMSEDFCSKCSVCNSSRLDGPNSVHHSGDVRGITEFVSQCHYEAEADNMLPLKLGEIVHVGLDGQDSDQWYWAFSPRLRKYGFIPKEHVKIPMVTII